MLVAALTVGLGAGLEVKFRKGGKKPSQHTSQSQLRIFHREVLTFFYESSPTTLPKPVVSSMTNEQSHARSKTQNHYTIVPAPLRIEPDTVNMNAPTTMLRRLCQTKSS